MQALKFNQSKEAIKLHIATASEELNRVQKTLEGYKKALWEVENKSNIMKKFNDIKNRLNERFASDKDYVHFKQHADILPKIFRMIKANLFVIESTHYRERKKKIIWLVLDLLKDRTSVEMIRGIATDILNGFQIGYRDENVDYQTVVTVRRDWRYKNKSSYDARTHQNIIDRNMVAV
jgi:hypothetical protein